MHCLLSLRGKVFQPPLFANGAMCSSAELLTQTGRKDLELKGKITKFLNLQT